MVYLGNPLNVPDWVGNKKQSRLNIKYDKGIFFIYAYINKTPVKIKLVNSNKDIHQSKWEYGTDTKIFTYRNMVCGNKISPAVLPVTTCSCAWIKKKGSPQ